MNDFKQRSVGDVPAPAPIDMFIACRCAACKRLDRATAAAWPESESDELDACWEEIERTCPRYAAAFGAAYKFADDRQQELFQ